MQKWKYKIGDKIFTIDGRIGIIQDLQSSTVDSKWIPSYWVMYSRKVYADGCARNTWETSIAGIIPGRTYTTTIKRELDDILNIIAKKSLKSK